MTHATPDTSHDDDKPLDQAWVLSTFTVIPGRGAIINHVLSLFKTRREWIVKAGRDGADDSDESFCILIVHTRGDVRRLCAAMAVPLPTHAGEGGGR